MNKLYFLTFNEPFSGVIKSQVIDVIKLYKSEGIGIRLISFQSIRSFKENKKLLKEELPDSIVIPSFPKIKNWKLNKLFLKLILKAGDTVICRNPISANLCIGLNLMVKTIYDGRGALSAESSEYGVFKGSGIERDIQNLEKKAVLNCHSRISVSNKLVYYWQETFGLSKDERLEVIPCSLSDNFDVVPKKKERESLKIELGYSEDNIILVYSGSLAKWQSLGKFKNFYREILKNNDKVKVLFLSKKNKVVEDLIREFPLRVINKFIKPEEVPLYLSICDYGVLLREDSITNRVASPVKCAEYLAMGLEVIISNKIGDYSEFIDKNKLGTVLRPLDDYNLKLEKNSRKLEIRRMALKYFSKKSEGIKKSYLTLLN